MARPRVEPQRKAVSKPVSLYPRHIEFAKRQALRAGSLSRYFQLLADYDRRHKVLPQALEEASGV